MFRLIGHYMIPSSMMPPYDNLVGGTLASFDKNQGHMTIGVFRISAFCAPRLPWSDLTFWLQTAPTSCLLLPHCTSSFCGHFFNYVMMSEIARAPCALMPGLLSFYRAMSQFLPL